MCFFLSNLFNSSPILQCFYHIHFFLHLSFNFFFEPLSNFLFFSFLPFFFITLISSLSFIFFSAFTLLSSNFLCRWLWYFYQLAWNLIICVGDEVLGQPYSQASHCSDPFFLSASILFGSWFSERSFGCVKLIATVLFLLSYIKENTDGKRRGPASQFAIREEMVMKWEKRQ